MVILVELRTQTYAQTRTGSFDSTVMFVASGQEKAIEFIKNNPDACCDDFWWVTTCEVIDVDVEDLWKTGNYPEGYYEYYKCYNQAGDELETQPIKYRRG